MKPTKILFETLKWSAILLLFGPSTILAAPNANETGRLKHVGSVTHDDLQGVVGLTVSADGNHLYAAAFHLNTVSVFSRDAKTGGLTLVQTLQSDENLNGVVSIQLSANGRYAATAAFRSGTVALYERDAESGQLTILDTAGKGKVQGLDFAIRAKFSHDDKYVYVLDGEDGGITALEVAPGDKLQWVQTNTGKSGSLGGSRGLCILPDGKTIVTANYRGNSIAVLDRNPTTGTTSVRQLVREDDGDVHALQGAFGVAASADGRFIYSCSGRFVGDQAVCSFEMNDEGKLSLLQEFVAGEGNFKPYLGGNCIVVSPDGRNVYATATESGSLACFDRDLKNGKLHCMETLEDGRNAGDLRGAAGVECSPDGKFVYVAAEFKKTISIYQRTSP